MAEIKKHVNGASFEGFCHATYTVNELEHVAARLHFAVEQAKKAVEFTEGANERVKELCQGIHDLAKHYKGTTLEADLLKLLEE